MGSGRRNTSIGNVFGKAAYVSLLAVASACAPADIRDAFDGVVLHVFSRKVPINIRLFMLNAIFMQAYTLFLHSGERIRMPLHQVIIDPYEHNIHHHYGFKNYNFALYFTWWDVLMGTHKATMPAWEKERAAGPRKVVSRVIAKEKPLGALIFHTVFECKPEALVFELFVFVSFSFPLVSFSFLFIFVFFQPISLFPRERSTWCSIF